MTWGHGLPACPVPWEPGSSFPRSGGCQRICHVLQSHHGNRELLFLFFFFFNFYLFMIVTHREREAET